MPSVSAENGDMSFTSHVVPPLPSTGVRRPERARRQPPGAALCTGNLASAKALGTRHGPDRC
ncbi:hypothetical protein EYF80_029765 [Liparis tanakae]|uniref:Uncharacterized protein n=1 Tax=Liparis tanakae TaxID=230148 RepID=A0A4Z2H289_9TELE|nr:hypothetical protein EYF80_029765 [Liparis tanakae]